MRTDPHRPGAIIPSDYDFVLWYALATTVNGWPQPSMHINCELDKRTEVGDKIVNGQHRVNNILGYMDCCVVALRGSTLRWALTGSAGNCSVCGAYFVYGEIWRHKPTGEHIHLGHTCAEKYQLLTDLSELEAWRTKQSDLRATALLKKARQDAQAAFLQARPDLAAALELGTPSPLTGESAPGRGPRDILWDLASKLHRFGTLSEKQVELAHRLAEQIRNPPPPDITVQAPAGRVPFEGEVISVKSYENDFGENWKMTVKVPKDGGVWLCFVSVPQALISQYMSEFHYEGGLSNWLRGKKVALTATLTPGRDPHFAFGKRPTGARILEQAA